MAGWCHRCCPRSPRYKKPFLPHKVGRPAWVQLTDDLYTYGCLVKLNTSAVVRSNKWTWEAPHACTIFTWPVFPFGHHDGAHTHSSMQQPLWSCCACLIIITNSRVCTQLKRNGKRRIKWEEASGGGLVLVWRSGIMFPNLGFPSAAAALPPNGLEMMGLWDPLIALPARQYY